MTTTPLGVAVVGHAFMGRAHSNAWRNVNAFRPDVPAAAQTVLVGRDEGRAKAAANQLGWAEASTDLRAVLERDDIHIVDVCVPGHLHCEVATAALQAGKHVLAEKPLANTVAEAEEMVQIARAVRARGVQSMVGFNYRRVPALALARHYIAEGRIGEVRQLRIAYHQDWLADPAAPMTWRLRKETAGSGALGDLASHAVDQVRFLLGQEIVDVAGAVETFVGERTGDHGPEQVTVDDAAWSILRTSGGAVATVEVTRMAFGRKNGLSIEVFGSAGALSFHLESLNELQVCLDGDPWFRRILVTEADHPYLDVWWPPGHIVGWDSTFTNQAADLLHAIGSGQEPSPSFEDGLAVQKVLTAIEASAADATRRTDPEVTR